MTKTFTFSILPLTPITIGFAMQNPLILSYNQRVYNNTTIIDNHSGATDISKNTEINSALINLNKNID